MGGGGHRCGYRPHRVAAHLDSQAFCYCALITGPSGETRRSLVTDREKGSFDPPSSEDRNRFAVYWVDYKPDGYHVAGFAFDGEGNEFARWYSTGNPDFGLGGQSMSYQWAGEVIGLHDSTDKIDRTGGNACLSQ